MGAKLRARTTGTHVDRPVCQSYSILHGLINHSYHLRVGSTMLLKELQSPLEMFKLTLRESAGGTVEVALEA